MPTTRKFNQNTHIPGQWNAICDVCGFKFKSGDLRPRWDGIMVCAEDWETRHPSDFQRGVTDDPSVPWTRQDSNADEDTPDTVGDADATITFGTDHEIQVWDTDLTANRTCTIATGTAIVYDTFTIYRTGGGAYSLTITDGTTIRVIPASVEALVVVTFDGANWQEESYTTLGL